ncbi:MAG TPA: hypothetical protein VH641_09490 [Streptosporangiaceae bacterium]|jgi:hypothetical protein
MTRRAFGVSRPSSVAVPADKQIARLDALAAEVIAHGWTAYVTTPLGRPVRLFVQDPGDPAMCSYIVTAPDDASGEWWYWFGWAERIAPAEMPATAAAAIVRVLRRPAERG